jgi:hypothetical protein
MLDNYTPRVARSPWGIACLILDVLPIPGLGTIIAGVRDGRNLTRDVVIGILQFILAFALIGWVWSIVWGIAIFVNSAPGAASGRTIGGARPH